MRARNQLKCLASRAGLFGVERKLIVAVISPLDFEVERERVHQYMSRGLIYDWVMIDQSAHVPLNTCCIVLCGRTSREPATERCLAFAIERSGRRHWFGITTRHHAPAELYGVTAFVPVADVAGVLFGR